jgi:hypothetical protein
MKKRILLSGIVLLASGLVGCAPKIYLVDRHTVLEEEAAGEWPDFGEDLLEKSSDLGPVPYPKTTTVSEERRRQYQILNGELGFKQTSKSVQSTAKGK